MADFNNFPTPKKIALDNFKLNLSSIEKNADDKPASLSWQFVGNNPRITVWSNEQADKSQKHGGRLVCKLDLPNFFNLMEFILIAADHDGDYKMLINSKDFTFFNRERSKEPVITATAYVGKDKDGVWISVTAPNRQRFRFGFGPNNFFEYVRGDGTPYTRAELSIPAAKAYVKLLSSVMAHLTVTEYKEPEKKPPQNGGGGYQGGGNGGGNNYNNNRNQGNGNGGGNGGGGRPSGGGFSEDNLNDIPF